MRRYSTQELLVSRIQLRCDIRWRLMYWSVASPLGLETELELANSSEQELKSHVWHGAPPWRCHELSEASARAREELSQVATLS